MKHKIKILTALVVTSVVVAGCVTKGINHSRQSTRPSMESASILPYTSGDASARRPFILPTVSTFEYILYPGNSNDWHRVATTETYLHNSIEAGLSKEKEAIQKMNAIVDAPDLLVLIEARAIQARMSLAQAQYDAWQNYLSAIRSINGILDVCVSLHKEEDRDCLNNCIKQFFLYTEITNGVPVQTLKMRGKLDD